MFTFLRFEHTKFVFWIVLNFAVKNRTDITYKKVLLNLFKISNFYDCVFNLKILKKNTNFVKSATSIQTTKIKKISFLQTFNFRLLLCSLWNEKNLIDTFWSFSLNVYFSFYESIVEQTCYSLNFVHSELGTEF